MGKFRRSQQGKRKRKKGEKFYKGEEDVEDPRFDSGERIREVIPESDDQIIEPEPKQKTEVNEQQEDYQDFLFEEKPSDYSKLITSLQKEGKYKEFYKKRKKEEEGREFSSSDEEKEEEQQIDKKKVEKDKLNDEEFDNEEMEENDIMEKTLFKDAEYEEEMEGDEYTKHFNADYSKEISQMKNNPNEKKKPQVLDTFLGRVSSIGAITNPKKNLSDYKIKKRLLEKVQQNGQNFPSKFQNHLFSAMNNYCDILYTKRKHEDSSQIQQICAIHMLNHIFKTRDKVLKGNAKLNSVEPSVRDTIEIKDQGFTRPKILLLLPFRNSALEFIKAIFSFTPKVQQGRIANKSRFFEEYEIDPEEEFDEKTKQHHLPEFTKIFSGNIDDCFRIGISFTRKSIKLYSEFYNSDIIVASPLGLRMVIGAPGEKNHDHDFLSSIEMVVVDQADAIMMQNWEHMEFIFESLNQIPKKANNTDFSRVKEWYLDGDSKYYRQNIIFSSILTPDINSLWNRYCLNVKGRLKIREPKFEGSIRQVIPKIKQIFQRINCADVKDLDETRLNYFIEDMANNLRTSFQSNTLIYIPSYFDYVRIRNFLRKEDFSYCQCCEYTTVSNISRSRSNFFHGRKKILLFTERFHYYHRYRIRGIKNIIFFGVPQFPHFYPEMLNLISEGDGTSVMIFTKYDRFALERIVGTSRCDRMIQSEKSTFLFC